MNKTEYSDAFIATAESRATSLEVMEAISFFARNETEADILWRGDGFETIATFPDIWEHATGNGRIDDTQLFWGDYNLAQIKKLSLHQMGTYLYDNKEGE